MRRTILGGLVLVATTASACGGESRLGTYADPEPGDIVSQRAGPVWETTQAELADLTSASYTAQLANQRCSKASSTACQLTTETIRTDGTFTLRPASVQADLKVTVPATENAGKGNTTVQMRELPNGALYSRETSDPTSCWLTWDRSYRDTFEAGYRAGLEVLRTAEVDYDFPPSSGTVQLAAKANALAVVRTLGLAPAFDNTYGITPQVRKELSQKTVSLQIKVGAGGSSVSFTADGHQVAAEINPGGAAPAGYLVTVQRSWSSFTLKDFGTALQVEAPPADQTLAKGAPSGATCG